MPVFRLTQQFEDRELSRTKLYIYAYIHMVFSEWKSGLCYKRRMLSQQNKNDEKEEVEEEQNIPKSQQHCHRHYNPHFDVFAFAVFSV